MTIGAWIYFWAFYFVSLIYISAFVPVPYCLDDCGFVVEPEVRQVDSPSSILLSQEISAKETKETIAKINKAKSSFFEKIITIDKPLARLIRRKEEESNQQN